VLNYHTALSALWNWAVEEELVTENIVHRVHRPEPEINVIIPFTEEDIKAMFKVLQTTRPYSRPGKCTSVHSIPNHERNRAIIYLLLDTGMRASELCSARIHHVDFKNRRITVFGKLSKERYLPFCARTGQALWKYLAAARRNASTHEYLFTTFHDTEFNRDRLLKLLHDIGKRAEIENVHPHRFRHTFAITYLRNGGDPWSLQMMLGHSTMDMVRRYLAIAQADLDRVHRTASPVDNWRL
jgi:site-specific recombinase XerD